jgi:aryl-alcohol dehydrogenase-like predicted oxidoreductase
VEFRPLGTSGLSVSVAGLGCNNFGGRIDFAASRAVVHKALDLGVNFFDTADTYGERGASEEYLGKILGPRRNEAIIATKFGLPMSKDAPERNASSRYVMAAVEASLKRLGTDRIDLYQIHFPDPATPIEETLSALDDLVREGKVRYLGSSNFTGWQVAEAEWVSRTRRLERFVSAQNEYSWLERDIESDLVPALEHYGVGLLPYFPLASGLLTGKYRRGQSAPEGSRLRVWNREDALTGETFDVLESLEAFAKARDLVLLDVAMGGLAAQPAVSSVIAGATSREQVAKNVAAGSWRPTAEDLAELREITG